MTTLDFADKLAGVDPLAPPPPPPRRNEVECTFNDIITIGESYEGRETAIPAGVNPDDPLWRHELQAMDAKWPDGPLILRASTKLLDKEGRPMSEGQRPHLLATAYAGLGIVAFPLTDNYDESRVVGNKFVIESKPMKFPEGSFYPLPVAELGPDYIFAKDVRILTPREAGAAGGEAPGQAAMPTTQELMDNEDLKAKLVGALTGQAENADVLGLLSGNGLGGAIQIDGTGLMTLAATDQLIPTLVGLDLVKVVDGVIEAA